MKLVHTTDIPEVQTVNPRQGVLRARRLLHGEPGTLGNFCFQFSGTDGDFFSPRHRHNFEQFRYQLGGEFDFDRNGVMAPGVLGYFPEGAFYGPQTSGVASDTVVLQFGGPGCEGYMCVEDLERGTEELKKIGVFEKGVFRRNEAVEGKKNMDGYQAVWEHINQRPMVYPKPRYETPVLINTAHHQWMPTDERGVSEKMLGTFTERRAEALVLKLDAGASHRARGRRIYFTLSGAGTADRQAYRKHTAIYFDAGETGTLTASENTEILVLGLPRFPEDSRTAAAAE